MYFLLEKEDIDLIKFFTKSKCYIRVGYLPPLPYSIPRVHPIRVPYSLRNLMKTNKLHTDK